MSDPKQQRLNVLITLVKVYDLGIELNLGLDTFASYGFDNIALGYPESGNTASQTHQVIAVGGDPKYYLGVIGVNPQATNFSDLNNPQDSFLSSLRNHNQIPSLAWSYTAGGKPKIFDVDSSLHKHRVLTYNEQLPIVRSAEDLMFGSCLPRPQCRI